MTDLDEVMATMASMQRIIQRLLDERDALALDSKRLHYAADHGWVDIARIDAAIQGFRDPEATAD